MEPTLRNKDSVASDFVDNAMRASDAAGPITGKLMAERLRFANAREGVQPDIVEQAFNSLADPLVGATPVFDVSLRLR
jgi:hypothetical protein